MLASGDAIQLKLRGLRDLLNPEPSPLAVGAVTPDAENFIVKRAKQFSSKERIRLVIFLPHETAKDIDGAHVAGAVASHFRNAANMEAADIRELFRYGCKALAVGLLVLAACLILAWYLAEKFPERPVARVFQESFVILGWVSMWRPIEIFLYEWLPLVRRRNLFRRLSEATVTIDDEVAVR